MMDYALNCFAAGMEVDEYHDECNYKEHVNEPTDGRAAHETKQPEDH